MDSEDTNCEYMDSEDTNSETASSENTKSKDTNSKNTNSENTNSERIPGAIKLPLEDKFLDPQNVLTLLLTHRPSGKSVPRGIKENVAFVLENENNLVRNANGNRSCYVDDCGAWSSTGSCKTHHYIMAEDKKLDYVDKKNGQYVKSVKGKRVVIDPQPPVQKVIVFKRYYTCLKRDPSYKRRVSSVIQCPENMADLKNEIVVEYIGKFCQETVPHGNSKKTTSEYVRTSCSVKRKFEELTDTNKALAPRDIYERMVLNGSDCAPRDLKQVQNAKYQAKKKKTGHVPHLKNIADEVQTLLSDVHEHPFIQEIIQTKGKPPSVILYLDDNLRDIKQFCSTNARNPSVLGIDRTFNLGACFATTLVYQHNNLKRKGKDNAPIFLAAIYLHWDGSYPTYHRFFSHLQSKFGNDIGGTQHSQFVIGSDEEAALTKAIKTCFPSAVHVLCTRHLEENVRRYLTNKIGLDDNGRRKIQGDLFGKHGLIACNSVKSFELKYIKLLDKFHKCLPAFENYFIKIAEKIRACIFEPRQNSKWIPIDWKNNSCESMNHIIKLSSK